MTTALTSIFALGCAAASIAILAFAVRAEERESDRAEHEAVERRVALHERAKALRFPNGLRT